MAEQRYSLYLQDTHSLHESIKLVQYGEMRGLDAVWQAEGRFTRDLVVTLAAYAATTYRIKIGAGVMNVYTRNALTIASTFLTLDDLAIDRVMVGLGMWHDALARVAGVNRHKPLLALRETTQALRALLAGEVVTVQGEHVQLESASLEITRNATRPEPRRLPIYFGVTGAHVAALAGEIADGVLLNSLVSPAYNRQTIDELERGLRKAGRTLDAIERPQLIVCSVDPDRQKALQAARVVVTGAIAQQPALMRACGVPQGLIDEVTQVMSWAGEGDMLSDAAKLVPDDVVQLVTAAGSADEVRAKVQEYFDSGATNAVLYPLGRDVRYMIDVFTDRLAR
jgi:5,10-methylenetetrahydromethanopterin reductase